MRYLIASIILLSLVSCGSDDKPQGQAAVVECNTSETSAKKIWRRSSTGSTYDLRTCNVGTVCNMVAVPTNPAQDFTLEYSENGSAIVNGSLQGNWKVCNGVMELYDFSNGSATEYYTEV